MRKFLWVIFALLNPDRDLESGTALRILIRNSMMMYGKSVQKITQIMEYQN
jgi:hypothetical protein